MRGIKCRDCEEYRNEWCEKKIDSPDPEMVRDCQYYHEKDPDIVRVIRCKDCKHYINEHICQYFSRFGTIETSPYAYCAYGERRD